MVVLTDLESELVLKIFKDFSTDYNPSSIAKEVKKTRMGTFKALQSLEAKGIVKGQTLGKARFYKLNLESPYAKKTAELLLMNEANRHQKWIDEFKELFSHVNIAIIFGSIIKNEKNAKDIDLLLVYPEKNNALVNAFMKGKNELLVKTIHPVKQTNEDVIKNLKKKDAIIIDAVKTGVVLHGFQEFVELIANVRSQ
jgi:predicted nucleotidyltransferase